MWPLNLKKFIKNLMQEKNYRDDHYHFMASTGRDCIWKGEQTKLSVFGRPLLTTQFRLATNGMNIFYEL